MRSRFSLLLLRPLLGSLLALAAPAVLCLAFFLEAPRPSPERVLTLLGVWALAVGIALHVLGGLRRGADVGDAGVR